MGENVLADNWKDCVIEGAKETIQAAKEEFEKCDAKIKETVKSELAASNEEISEMSEEIIREHGWAKTGLENAINNHEKVDHLIKKFDAAGRRFEFIDEPHMDGFYNGSWGRQYPRISRTLCVFDKKGTAKAWYKVHSAPTDGIENGWHSMNIIKRSSSYWRVPPIMRKAFSAAAKLHLAMLPYEVSLKTAYGMIGEHIGYRDRIMRFKRVTYGVAYGFNPASGDSIGIAYGLANLKNNASIEITGPVWHIDNRLWVNNQNVADGSGEEKRKCGGIIQFYSFREGSLTSAYQKRPLVYTDIAKNELTSKMKSPIQEASYDWLSLPKDQIKRRISAIREIRSKK